MGDRILVVDDDPDILQYVKMNLEREGFEAETASNCVEALHVARQRPPALVLMDVMMPGMDGLEATRLICERYADKSVRPHIVGVSAFIDELTRDRGRAAGMAAFLGKPIRPDDLFAAVEQQTPEATEVGTEPEAEVAAG